MKCNQRPFKKNKTRKKTKNKRPSRRFSAFISSVRQYIDYCRTLAINSNSSVDNKFYNNIENLIDIDKYKLIPWEKVTPVQRISFFFYYLALKPDYKYILPFTLDVSDTMRDAYSKLTYEKDAKCIRKRLYDEFFHHLGYIPRYAFVIENKNTQFHLHGVIEVIPETKDKLRKAMKAATFGPDYKKSIMHRNILRIEKEYRKSPEKWLCYINKFQSAAYSLFISNSLKQDIKSEYEALLNTSTSYKEAQKTATHLNIQPIKEEYIKNTMIESTPHVNTTNEAPDTFIQESNLPQTDDNGIINRNFDTDKYNNIFIVGEYPPIKPYISGLSRQRIYLSYIPPPFV